MTIGVNSDVLLSDDVVEASSTVFTSETLFEVFSVNILYANIVAVWAASHADWTVSEGLFEKFIDFLFSS